MRWVGARTWRCPRGRVRAVERGPSRSALLAGRPSVVVLDEDLAALEALMGSRTGAHAAIEGLASQGRLHRVRRGTYVLVDQTGGLRVGVLDLIAALTPKPYLVTGGGRFSFMS